MDLSQTSERELASLVQRSSLQLSEIPVRKRVAVEELLMQRQAETLKVEVKVPTKKAAKKAKTSKTKKTALKKKE